MPYVELDGIATYYEVHGAGEPVLLLHGGFCSIETLQPQIDAASRSATRCTPRSGPGQGRTADRDGPITFDGWSATPSPTSTRSTSQPPT